MLEPLASHRGTTPGVSKSEVAGLLKATQSFDGQLVTELPMNVTLNVRRKRARENSFIQMPPLEGGQEGMRGDVFWARAGTTRWSCSVAIRIVGSEPQASMFAHH